LVLGLVAIILLEYFNDVIYTPEALRKTTGLTYLGGLARHRRLRGANGAVPTRGRPHAQRGTLSTDHVPCLGTLDGDPLVGSVVLPALPGETQPDRRPARPAPLGYAVVAALR